MESMVYELLAKRRDRVIAIILGVKERECDQYLSSEAQNKLRKVVLDQINDFHGLMLDLIRSTADESVILNELWLEKLDMMTQNIGEIHQQLVVKNGKGLSEQVGVC